MTYKTKFNDNVGSLTRRLIIRELDKLNGDKSITYMPWIAQLFYCTVSINHDAKEAIFNYAGV